MPETIAGVSVIVPARNSGRQLPDFFRKLRHCDVLEVLVCDLGSTDETVALSRDAGAHIVRGVGGLAEAASKAAATVRGSCVWLLAPECRPPAGVAQEILGILAEERIAIGYFPVHSFAGFGGWWRARRANCAAAWRGGLRLEHGPFLARSLFAVLEGCLAGADPLACLYGEARRHGAAFRAPVSMRLEGA